MDRGRAAAITMLAAVSIGVGVVAEANLRYIPEWPGSPRTIPPSLTMVTVMAALAGLGAALGLLAEAIQSPRKWTFVGLPGLALAAWPFYLLYVLYHTLLDATNPHPKILGLGLLPAYTAWLITAPPAATRIGAPQSIAQATGATIGITSIILYTPLYIIGEEDSWEKLVGHTIILTLIAATLTLLPTHRTLTQAQTTQAHP